MTYLNSTTIPVRFGNHSDLLPVSIPVRIEGAICLPTGCTQSARDIAEKIITVEGIGSRNYNRHCKTVTLGLDLEHLGYSIEMPVYRANRFHVRNHNTGAHYEVSVEFRTSPEAYPGEPVITASCACEQYRRSDLLGFGWCKHSEAVCLRLEAVFAFLADTFHLTLLGAVVVFSEGLADLIARRDAQPFDTGTESNDRYRDLFIFPRRSPAPPDFRSMTPEQREREADRLRRLRELDFDDFDAVNSVEEDV